MSTVNAPQPTPSGPAESFDSTVAPPTSNVSTIGLPGPNNVEAPVHTGEANGIDPFFHTQYIAMSQFTWTVSDNPAKLLWSIPIHPSETHQWLAHLAKMYNAWAGGIDFAVKVAGTGFHAGAIMIARIPPNIQPSKLLTVPDITAFEYSVIDPKMLEVEVKTVMDQRNVMYHYMPLDVRDHQTFGGFLAIYVMLPLATSSTGATEISIQVLARPARNFLFTQIRPIRMDVVPLAVPYDLENALDFTQEITSVRTLDNITKITVHAPTDLRYLDSQTINCLTFGQDPMNGYFLPRLPTAARMKPPKEMVSDKLTFIETGDKTDWILNFPAGDSVLAWNTTIFQDTDIQFPILNGEGSMVFTVQRKDKENFYNITFFGTFQPVNPGTDPDEYKNLKQKFVISYFSHDPSTGMLMQFKKEYFDLEPKFSDNFGKNISLAFIQLKNPSYDFELRKYTPPITESLITFDSANSTDAQPWEFRQALAHSAYAGSMTERDALVFELIDTLVDLPVMPFKLHYSGYFTTYAHKNNIEFKLLPQKRYRMRYTNKIGAATPLVAGRSLAEYVRNNAISHAIV